MARRARRYRIVVSAENSPYLAWQARLFHFSCLSRLNHTPIIIVHDCGSKWRRDFQELADAGAIVSRAPSYRITSNGDDYLPRNTAGTLLHAAELCPAKDEFIVLCDPDMIFVRKPDFSSGLSGEYYGYVNYDRKPVRRAAKKIGIKLEMLDRQKRELCCGVPYVIPVAVAKRLAEAWLQAIDAFSPRHWEDQMHAFGLAVVKLGLRLTLTHMMNHNYWPNAPVDRDVIHYCYGDETWNKRSYFTARQARKVWSPAAPAQQGTILAELVSQIREARDFYSALRRCLPCSGYPGLRTCERIDRLFQCGHIPLLEKEGWLRH
jgi:hypothetical protein